MSDTTTAVELLEPEAHPALHPSGWSHVGPMTPAERERRHFAPAGWEHVERGICPCGEVVRWLDAEERWVPDRSLIVLIVTEAEARALRETCPEALEPMLDYQFAANDADPEAGEYDDGKVLIAGVLYDEQTLEEADPQ